MEVILLVIIVIQFVYKVYSDIQNRSERELLQLKLMSKDLDDYVSSTEETEDGPVEEPDPYIDMSDANVEQILRAKERL